jgi:hypothetical protein
LGILDLVRNAVLRQDQQDQQAAARTYESERPQYYFARHDDEALARLRNRHPDEVAAAYLELMRLYMQTEEENAELKEQLKYEKTSR